MSKRFSIAEARQNLAAIIHELEQDSPVELTRRGEPVAVLLSTEDYQRRLTPSAQFWQAYIAFRADLAVEGLVDTSDAFADLRDYSPGREVAL